MNRVSLTNKDSIITVSVINFLHSSIQFVSVDNEGRQTQHNIPYYEVICIVPITNNP